MALENYLFTREHEWLDVDGETAWMGVSDYAQHELGDVVYVELPAVGKTFKKGDPCANIESVKAVSDVYAPVAGSVLEANEALSDNPELVNKSPYEDGRLFRMQLSNKEELKELMTYAQYEEYLKGIAGE